MAAEFTERQERKIEAIIDNLTSHGHYTVGGPFWADVLASARDLIAVDQSSADEFRRYGNEAMATSIEAKLGVKIEVLRRLEAMS